MNQKYMVYVIDNRSLEERILSSRDGLKPWEIEEKAMEEPKDVFDCVAKHILSQNDFNKTFIIDKMRKMFCEKQKKEIYILGIGYAEKIKRKDLVEEFEEKFKHYYPVRGKIYSSLLNCTMEYYNPFDDL
jgi:hypothetical protein